MIQNKGSIKGLTEMSGDLTSVTDAFFTPVELGIEAEQNSITNFFSAKKLAAASIRPQQPATPSALAVTQMTACDIDGSFIDNSGGEAFSFEVQRSQLSDFSVIDKTIATVSTEFSDGNLTDGITYYYRVRALGVIPSPYTSGVSVTINAALDPSTQITLDATVPDLGDVTLTWSYSSFDGETQVERSLDGGSGWALIATVASGTNTYLDSSGSDTNSPRYRIKKSDWTCYSQEEVLSEFAETWIGRLTTPTTTEVNAIVKYCVTDADFLAVTDEIICPSLVTGNSGNSLVGAVSKTGTAVNSPSITLQGAAFTNAGQEYIDSNFNVQTDPTKYGSGDARMEVFFTALNNSSNRWMMGATAGNPNNFSGRIANTGNNLKAFAVFGSDNSLAIGNNPEDVELFAITSNSSSSGNNWLEENGVPVGQGNSTINWPTNAPNLTAFIGARSNNGSWNNGGDSTIAWWSTGAGEGFNRLDHYNNVRQFLLDLGVVL